MKITVDLNDKLVQHGLELGGSQSMDVVLADALNEYVSKRLNGGLAPHKVSEAKAEAPRSYPSKEERQALIDAFGTFDLESDEERKAHR